MSPVSPPNLSPGACAPSPAFRRRAAPIRLSIGEPQNATPELVKSAHTGNLAGLSAYPATAGLDAVREAMAAWFVRRFKVPHLDPATQVLPVSGTREALFAIAQAVVDSSKASPLVVSPNPFYQIYEGAALLAGAEPIFLNTTAEARFQPDLDSVPPDIWKRTCSSSPSICGDVHTSSASGRSRFPRAPARNRPLVPAGNG
jgi:aspartate/methionine/tyrosine aminotransferase